MPSAPTSLEFHLLGSIEFDACQELQQRLIQLARKADRPRAFVLLAEHPPLITIGRDGSRADVRLLDEQRKRKGLRIEYVARGGGAWLHAPGQLAVYPILPLSALGWTVGQYARRLQAGFSAALAELGIASQSLAGRLLLAGRTGPLVVFGLAVRFDVTWQGAFVNIAPPPLPFGYIDVIPASAAAASPSGLISTKTTQSSLLAERGRALTMPRVRTAIVEKLSQALGLPQFHLHTGPPVLPNLADG